MPQLDVIILCLIFRLFDIYLYMIFILFTVGEPLNREAWEWYYNVVGEKRCDICDTWWQTGNLAHILHCVNINSPTIQCYLQQYDKSSRMINIMALRRTLEFESL